MLTQLTTSFVNRLRTGDQSAWFELWETFGPVLRAQLTRWGRGRIGPETVRDLSQETLAALSDSLHRFDPSRGVENQIVVDAKKAGKEGVLVRYQIGSAKQFGALTLSNE